MRAIRYILLAVILGFAGIAGAVGPMTLTRAGDLYSVATVENQVVVTVRYADGTVEELYVPQSAAAVDDSLQVGVDEVTGSIIVLWQKLSGMTAKVRLAVYVDGTWIGPETIAGNDGTAAQNPRLLVHRARTVLVELPDTDGDPIKTAIETTFIHAVWWSKLSEEDNGRAHYASVPLDADGVPLFSQIRETVLSDMLPYGAACYQIESVKALEQPKLFVDPQSGNPHVFLTDFEGCAFQIMELLPEVVEDADSPKRRRQIIILRHAHTVTIRPDLPLAASKFAVGHGLVIVAYWDGEDSRVNYVQMDRTGISETKTLKVGEALSHEQAIELIRGLTN